MGVSGSSGRGNSVHVMEVVPEYKIILLGEPGVGKTNFFFRLRDGVFVGSTASTVSTGIEHMEYKMRINGASIKVQVCSSPFFERPLMCHLLPYNQWLYMIWFSLHKQI